MNLLQLTLTPNRIYINIILFLSYVVVNLYIVNFIFFYLKSMVYFFIVYYIFILFYN